jgi:hypothetical protein
VEIFLNKGLGWHDTWQDCFVGSAWLGSSTSHSRLQLDRRLSTPPAIASCGPAMSVLLWLAPSGTPWQFFVAITEVLTMMSKIKIVVPDDRWISMILSSSRSQQMPAAILGVVKTMSQMIDVLQAIGSSNTGGLCSWWS